jgi:hypothetical protein
MAVTLADVGDIVVASPTGGERVPLTDEEKQKIADQRNSAIANKPAEYLARLRVVRNQLLDESDWTQVSDATADVDSWKTYRQALRDLPANVSDPANPSWPTKPGD